MSASYEVKGSIAVITLNNPPVNGLGHATRSGIFEGLKKALADKAVKAIVLTGAAATTFAELPSAPVAKLPRNADATLSPP